MLESLVGQHIGKYTLKRFLGSGGMAEVYEAWDTDLERRVALKLILKRLAQEPGYVQRFKREARTIARLQHPHIVLIYDYGEAGERPYLAMQLVDGRTLAEVIRQQRVWEPVRAARLMVHLASAVDYAHSQGLIHRDIKPGNIMITGDDHATLLDFGLVRVAEEAGMTQSGAFLGTPAYMSPEQIQGQSSKAGDVYSLGIVAYELLAGQPPFQAESTIAMMHKVVYEAPVPLQQKNPQTPQAVAEVIHKAISKEPSQRFATATEFAQALYTVSQGSPSVGTGQPHSRPAYEAPATSTTPALIVYLLDAGASMSLPMGSATRMAVVREALAWNIRQLVIRSTVGQTVFPRYRVAIFAYGDQVDDVLVGAQPVDRLIERLNLLDRLQPGRASETANSRTVVSAAQGFAEVESFLQKELAGGRAGPAPVVCHVTDGDRGGPDPTPSAARIRALGAPDGPVLVENVYVSDRDFSGPVRDARQWPGIAPHTELTDGYADKLRRLSSPLPESYRAWLAERGYHLAPGTVMLLPGASPELLRLALEMASAAPLR